MTQILIFIGWLAADAVAWLSGFLMFFAVAVMAKPELLTREQAAEYLGVKEATLACWASTGRYGLRVVRVGRLCRYRKSDLDEWLESRTQNGEAR